MWYGMAIICIPCIFITLKVFLMETKAPQAYLYIRNYYQDYTFMIIIIYTEWQHTTMLWLTCMCMVCRNYFQYSIYFDKQALNCLTGIVNLHLWHDFENVLDLWLWSWYSCWNCLLCFGIYFFRDLSTWHRRFLHPRINHNYLIT